MLTRWPLRLAAGIVGVALLGMGLVFMAAQREHRATPPGGPSVHTKPAALLHAPAPTSQHTLTRPEALAVARGLGANQPAYWVKSAHGALTARNVHQGVSARFTPSGAQLNARGGSVGLSLVSFGHQSAPAAVGSPHPHPLRNSVTYNYGDVSQSWYNGPLGFEQTLRVAHAPATGSGPLSFGFAVSGSLHARLAGGSVQLIDASGRAVLRYSDLTATDASGRTLPSAMSVRDGRPYLSIDAAGAHYPITIDPLVQLAKLTASDGQGGDSLGQAGSIAVSGNTIAVGAASASTGTLTSNGAVYVFVAPASGWANATETAKLTASDANDSDQLGSGVAISADGTTVAAGAPGATIGTTSAGVSAGAVYVFTEPSTGWASETQTAKLTEATLVANTSLGTSIAISGTTVFAGSELSNNDSGAVFFWNKPSTGWVNAGSNGSLTTNVTGLTLIGNALAATSNTLVVGAAFEGNGIGEVDVYVEPSGGWVSATQSAILTGSDSVSGDAFGSSVAISGNTIAIGAPGATIGSNSGQGAIYAFTEPSGGWTTATQTAKLTASDGGAGDSLGNAVATNGNTIYGGADSATVGGNAAQGAVYVYNEPTAGWANGTESAKISSSDGLASDQFGFSVAVAGSTLLVGAAAATVNGNLNQGAAYVFLQTAPPTVTTQPANATVASGGTATFTAAASGSPTPTVQWQVSTNGGTTWTNDTTDAGNTTGTLTVSGAAVVSPAREYRAVFTNSAGTATSNAATLSVTSAPVVTTQPANQTVNAGQNATFTAAASGVPAPTVQWQSAPSGSSTFTNVSGATSTTLTVSATTASQNGNQYRAVFTNTGGTATTTVATLTVQTPPSVTTQPASTTVTAGATATFTAAATGNPTPTVQWQSAPASAPTTFTNVSGATSTTLTVTGTTAAQNGTVYRAVFTNAVSSVNTNTATLTVNFAPTVTTPPANVTVNAGASATFTAAASANPAATVQWQSATASAPTTFTNISGATSTTLTVSATTASQNGNQYRAVFTNSVGSTNSAAATLTVDFAPTVTTQPASVTIASGGTTTFTAAASGNPTPTVQWQVSTNGGSTFTNDTADSGNTTGTLTVAGATTSGNEYRAVFTNSVGSATSSAATLTVQIPPTVTTQPANVTVNAGANATFTAAASASPAATVQWQSATASAPTTFTNISGATSTTLTVSATTASQNGNLYRAVFTNAVGTATTNAATLTVDFAPTVSAQPASATVTAGQTASFTAAASGNPTPTVQWQVSTNSGSTWANDTTDAGNTTGTLTVASTVAAQNGTEYRAVFTNSVGSATSSAATLTVDFAPSVTAQPANATVNAGSNATFTATASANPAATVQWQVSTNGGASFTNVSGATSTTLTVSAATAAQNGNEYQAVFTNSVGSATTNPATLTVDFLPTITTQPANVTCNAGATVTLTIAVTGNPPPTIQWQSSPPGITPASFTNISGATGSTLSIICSAALNGTQYRAVVTNSVGSVTSNTFTLTVDFPPAVTTQPANATVNAGSTATFTAAASGNPTPTVQWQVSTNGGTTFTNDTTDAGNTTGTLTVASTVASQNGNQYRAVFTNSVGTVTTTAATLTVDFAPTITTQPASTTVTAGQTASFTAAASGNPAPTVQWQSAPSGSSTFTNISGATSTTLTVSSTTASQNGTQYRAVFTNSVGSATSAVATLTVDFAPTVTTQPGNATATTGGTATFSAAASGNPTPTVQWQVSTDGGATFTNVSGATSTTLTVTAPSTVPSISPQYRAVFTNSIGAATTNAATLTVSAAPVAPTISAQPSSTTVNAGQTATFSAAANGVPTPTVQWQSAPSGSSTFANISGATSTTYTTPATTAAMNGTQYRAVFTNSQGTATTNAATLTVDFAPTVTAQPASVTVTTGANASFTATASGNPAATVQWQVSTDGGTTWNNDTTDSGNATGTLTVATTASLTGNEYRAVFTNSVGSATSNAATLTVNTLPTVASCPPPVVTVTAGQTVTLTVTFTGSPTPTVQWQSAPAGSTTFTNISGATSPTLTFTATASQNGAQFQVVVANAAGAATGCRVTLNVQFAPTVTTQPANATAPVGQTATFTAAASGNPTPTVQWQVSTDGGTTWNNDTTDSGNTTGTLTVANVTAGQSGDEYRAVFTNSIGSATSNAATLTTNAAPIVTTQPASVTVNAGQTATFTAAASGVPTPTVQWQSAPAGSSTFANISGATSTTYTTPATTAAMTGTQYRAVFTNVAGTATTTIATLTVDSAPAVTTQPASKQVTVGQTATFTAAASGSPAPTVQWQVSTNSGSTWANDTIDSGNTTGTLSVANTTTSESGYEYRAVFTNSVGSATSSAATLTVLPSNAPVVTGVFPNVGSSFGVVEIFGRNLTNVLAVYFGGPSHPAWFLGGSSGLIIALAPFEFHTTVDVQVKTRVGTSAVTPADRFTFR